MEHIVSGLIDERRTVAARLRDHMEEVQSLERLLTGIDEVLRHYGHYPDSKEKPKQKLSIGAFYKGELPRLVVSILSEAPDGLPTRDIVTAVCHRKSWRANDKAITDDLRHKVSRVLDKKRLQGVLVRVGDERAGVWRVTGSI